MGPDEFEDRMRALEVYHCQRFPPTASVIFSPFTETQFGKPFDSRLHELTVQTTQAVLQGREPSI